MTLKKTHSILLAMLVATLLPGAAPAQTTADYQPAWEKLKTLAGTWDSYTVGSEDKKAIISYHVTSGGSVLFEEFVGKTPDGVRDMASAYHMNVNDLVATHYCGAGNQPRMRAASYDPESRVLRFDFWDITHLADPTAYYTTNIELYFEDDDNVELRFRGNGEKEWQVHRMHRLTTRPHELETDEQ